jgi:anti-anti-sigma regulatory factor
MNIYSDLMKLEIKGSFIDRHIMNTLYSLWNIDIDILLWSTLETAIIFIQMMNKKCLITSEQTQ